MKASSKNRNRKESARGSTVDGRDVSKEVQYFWEKAHIPIRPFQDLVGKWEALKKNKGRRSETQQKNEEEFKETLIDHLCYLSDPDVMVEEKKAMVAAKETEVDEEPDKRVHVDLLSIGTKDLSNLVTNNTRNFFVILDLHQHLNKDPGTWANNVTYITTEETAKSQTVTNDTTERGGARRLSKSTTSSSQRLKNKRSLLCRLS